MTQPGNTRLVPYPLPAPVKALGEPEQVFRPGTHASGAGKIIAAILAVLAFGFLGVGGMLFYCAVHPFGTDPPPPVVCWIVGGILGLLGCASAFGSYYYFSGAGDNKQTYLIYSNCLVELFPRQHRIIPWEKIGASKSAVPLLKMFRFSTGTAKDVAFDSSLPKHDELAGLISSRSSSRVNSGRPILVATAAAAHAAGSNKTATKAPNFDEPKTLDEKNVKVGMESAILSEIARMEFMGALVEALIQAAPEHYAMLHLIAEVRKANGRTSILFTHGWPVLLAEYSTLVPDSIANAAFAIVDSLLREDDSFPGFEIVLRKTAAGKWNVEFHGLDEPGPHWSNLPRYPLRVCGYGLSLAPVPDTIFRWQRNTNPSGIIASVRHGDSKAQAKRVQVMLSDAGHKLVLGEGVAKAEEVIQVSEGPDTSQWMIETPIFRAAWPNGLDFRFPLASKTRFDLVTPDDTLIFVQGPGSNEPNLLETMATEGQTEIGRGKTSNGHEWIELGYEVQGKKWRQRHYVRKISPQQSFVVTAQCPQSIAEKIFHASDEVADSLNKPANLMG
jgi:hypothetical protein